MKADKLKQKFETLNLLRENTEQIKHALYLLGANGKQGGLEGPDLSVTQLLDLPVSKSSVFKESTWDFNLDVVNPAANVRGAKLKIDFSKYECIPQFIVVELKCLFQCVYLLPKRFKNPNRKGKNKGKSTLKPNTVIAHFESGMSYLDCMFKRLANKYTKKYVAESYQSLSDVDYDEFQLGMDSFKGAKNSALRVFLSYLVHPNFKNFLGVEVDFHMQIFEKAKFEEEQRQKEQSQKNQSQEEPYPEPKKKKYLSNEEFSDAVTYSSNRVMQFLIWQEKQSEIRDQTSLQFYMQHHAKKFEHDFEITPQILNEYAAIRLLAKGYKLSYVEYVCELPSYFFQSNGQLNKLADLRRSFKEHYQIEHLDSLRLQINQIYYASCYLICQYMGGRPEELSNIHFERSLAAKDEVPVIVSNVGKDDFENLKLFDEAWVRTPIMDDALKAAKMISIIYQNEYLLGNVDTLAPGIKQKEMTSSGMINFFNKYLAVCLLSNTQLSKEEKIKLIGFNPYYFRHTLAFQLHRMGVGLPLISFQLKHMVEGVERFSKNGAASETTIDYGGIAESLIESKEQGDFYYKQAEREKVMALYNPNGTYVGKPGKEHLARVQKFFAGYMAAGYTEDEVIEQLVEQGIAIIDVGTGFCGGGQEDFDESLPCIGTLRCNPHRCKHAVISQIHIPKWKELYMSNKSRLANEQDTEVKEQLIQVINEAKMVLDDLGVEV